MSIGSFHKYSKLFAIGHRGIANIFLDEVLVEEKIDGSQISFGVFNGEIKIRTRSAILEIEAPEKMFLKAVESIKELAPILTDGWTYRGEYLQKPKHNCLAYSRVPEKHIILWDISDGHKSYLPYEAKFAEAQRIGLECVPAFFRGMITTPEQFKSFLNTTSVLGGQNIEGVVVKNYSRFGIDGSVMMGKYVSELFKEVHQGSFRSQNPTNGDVIENLVYAYRTPARWNKAIQHLKERGTLKDSPEDIGPLLKEINKDVLEECGEEIKQKLFDWAWSKISRGITAGFPNWYKEELVKAAFPVEEEAA